MPLVDDDWSSIRQTSPSDLSGSPSCDRAMVANSPSDTLGEKYCSAMRFRTASASASTGLEGFGAVHGRRVATPSRVGEKRPRRQALGCVRFGFRPLVKPCRRFSRTRLSEFHSYARPLAFMQCSMPRGAAGSRVRIGWPVARSGSACGGRPGSRACATASAATGCAASG